jgi:hypothetical protein
MIFVQSLFVWLLLLATRGVVVVAVVENNDFLFDKSTCASGPHRVNATTTATTAPDTFNVRWKTTAAEEDIVVQVYREWAPTGVDRFYQLILDNYFNCAAFFRVVPGTT